MVEIASHRGGALLWPENSPTAFRNTAALPVEQVEFDVHLSRDGRLAVIHDATLDRTTSGQGPVGERSWAELQQVTLNGSNGERIPELRDVIAIFRPTAITLRLEIKPDPQRRRYAGLEQKVVEVLRVEGALDRTVVTSFQIDTLLEVRHHGAPRGVIWLVSPQVQIDAGVAGIIAVARHHAVPALSLNHALLDRDIVSQMRAAGLGIGGWGAKDDAAIERLLGLDIDVFTTDRPDRALALRDAASR